MDEERLQAFERMLDAVISKHEKTASRMERLKADGKERSATFLQLMGIKMQYQNMLAMYKSFGLLRDD